MFNVGTRKSNQALSLKRAQAVKNRLANEGIASNRMRTVGGDENDPIASNRTEEGRTDIDALNSMFSNNLLRNGGKKCSTI